MSVPKSEDLGAQASERASSGVPITTMMLRNIPNKYTQTSLLQEIDCLGFAGLYDLFYLPMDVHNRSNVGYAFINFEKPQDAERFRQTFSEHHFQRFHSRKIGSVCVAHVQGLEANLRHFENRAVTQAKNDQYRPIVLKGRQRVEFDCAVACTKFKEENVQRNAMHDPGKPWPNARERLEAAIRELLAQGRGGGACKEQRSEACKAAGGDNTPDTDVAHLLSLHNLLGTRLHATKPPVPEPCHGWEPVLCPVAAYDSPAYVDMSSYAMRDTNTYNQSVLNGDGLPLNAHRG